MTSLYEVLSVQVNASPGDIRRAYLALALSNHPDKVKQRSGDANEPKRNDRFNQIRHAYEVLSDSKTRAVYDSEIERAKKRREQGLPAETDRPNFSATSNFDGASKVSWEEAYPFGCLLAIALLSQHALLCLFRLRTVLVLNAVVLLGSCLAGYLMSTDLVVPLLGILGTLGGLFAYWLVHLFATRLLGYAMTVPLIASFAWEVSTLVAWLLGLPGETALFSSIALVGTQFVIHRPWYEEWTYFAFAVLVLIGTEKGDRAGDVILFFGVLKVLNNLLGIYHWSRWLLSSVFRFVIWGACFFVALRLLIFVYVRSGRPHWAQKILHNLDDIAFSICLRVLPASVMQEAYKINEERRTEEVAGQQPSPQKAREDKGSRKTK